MTTLIGEDLACERGGRIVFSDLSFTLGGSECMLVKGPNGAGKTTLLRAICGLSELTSGALHLGGFSGDLTIGQRAHYIAHADAIKPALSVAENLEFWAAFNGGGDVAAALAAFDLEPLSGYSAGLLSSGQRRRLALSRLAVSPRPIWLLDEPTVGLDSASQELLESLLETHLKAGGMALVASHTELNVKFSRELDMGAFACVT